MFTVHLTHCKNPWQCFYNDMASQCKMCRQPSTIYRLVCPTYRYRAVEKFKTVVSRMLVCYKTTKHSVMCDEKKRKDNPTQ